jgi:hypothetical protein
VGRVKDQREDSGCETRSLEGREERNRRESRRNSKWKEGREVKERREVGDTWTYGVSLPECGIKE